MNKSDLVTKYEHQLTLKNYSENTLRAYLNGLTIFFRICKHQSVQKVTSEVLSSFFITVKKILVIAIP